MFTTILIEPLANGLIVFYRLLGGNLGVAILFFSVFLRFILNPLTKPYMESMKKIRDLNPELDKIKKKFKGDKVKLAQAQSELYKQKGVNPGAGCLPYLLQIVILIAFFNVFTKTLSNGGDPTTNFNNLLYPQLTFQEGETLNTKFLYLDVTKPDTFSVSFLPFAIPGPFLILAAVVQLLSSKMMMPNVKEAGKQAKKTVDTTDDVAASVQQSMVYTFPVLTLLFGMQFASGLVIYWFVFSFWQFFQQYQSSGWGGLTPWIKRFGLIKSGAVK